MTMRVFALPIGLVSMALATSAFAHDHRVCFEPGTTILTPEGYAAARDAAAEMGGARSFPHIVLKVPGGSNAVGRAADQSWEVRLELVHAGVGLGRVEAVDGSQLNPDCVSLEIDASKPYFALFEFWGPYFGPGSDEVTPEWRRRMRGIVADYVPGETKYCIIGHADTAGAPEYNQALSLRRAENTALELVRQGVRWSDTVIAGRGETELARPTSDGVAEPLNRRVFVDVRTACPALR